MQNQSNLLITFDTIKNRSQWGFLSRQSVHTLSINTKGVGTFLIGGGEGGASEGVSRSSLILEGMYLREGQAYRYNWVVPQAQCEGKQTKI